METQTGTYADRAADLSLPSVWWNHGLSEVLNSLLKNGMELSAFDEFDYSPYNCFSHVIEAEPKKYRIAHLDNKIPMVYSLTAIRKNKP